MKALKYILLAGCLSLGGGAACAAGADSCATVALKEIVVLMNRTGGTGQTVRSTSMMGHKAVELRRDADGVITHVGYVLFPRQMTGSMPSPVYDFVERYLLKLSLSSEAERKAFLRDDQVTLSPAAPLFVDSLCAVNIRNGEKRYTVEWTAADGRRAVLSFPKSYELISGQNKLERDRLLESRLRASEKLHQTPAAVAGTGMEKHADLDYYVKKGQFYLLRDLNSDTYYLQDSEGAYVAVCNRHYPGETLSNIFGGLLDNKITLEITHKLYGLKQKTFTVGLAQLAEYCRQTGCTPYVGIESVSEDGLVKGTVIYENQDLGYNHLLYVEADAKVLECRNGVVKASLFSYVPTHNLTSLFTEKEKSKWKK